MEKDFKLKDMSENIKFCFVILNYNTFDYTINCINSIYKKCSNSNYKIVVVDNLSPDGSGNKLLQKYQSNSEVDVILNKENSGFACGNNAGITYALDKYNPKFIIVNNSDTLLLTNNFLNEIEKIYNEYKFAILGPKVNIVENNVQYIPKPMLTLKQIKHTIYYFMIRYFLSFIGLTLFDSKLFKVNNHINKNDENVNKIYKDVVIHGCFFVLSSTYFKYYRKIPEDSKFYREEDLLYLNCHNKELLTLYYPKLEIYHDVNGAIKSSYRDSRKRNLFKFKRHIVANIILYKKLKLHEKGKAK